MILAIHCIARQTLINTIMQQQTNRRTDAEKEGFCLLCWFLWGFVCLFAFWGLLLFGFFYKCALYPSSVKVVFHSSMMLKCISFCVDISLCDVKANKDSR